MDDIKPEGNLFSNVLGDIFKEILNEPATENAIQGLECLPTSLHMLTSNDAAPGFSYLTKDLVSKGKNAVKDEFVEALGEEDYNLKKMYTDADLVQFWASIVENAIYNIIQECTTGHSDLSSHTKIYLKKDNAKK